MSLQKFDSGDSQMDSSELLKFIQQNESVAELQSYADQESNKLLRWACGFAYVQVDSSVFSCVSHRPELMLSLCWTCI